MPPFNFIIIDDHKMLSSGLSSFLLSNFSQATCLGTFENADSCLSSIDNSCIGGAIQNVSDNLIAIVDLNLAGTYSFPLIKNFPKKR